MDTILLVDDNPLRASMRKSLLEGGLHCVVRAQDAADALCMVETPDFVQDLVLLITSHSMAGISGPEFVAEFRGRMPHVPVLVLTEAANAHRDYEGIEGVYVSPAKSPEDLRALVGQLIDIGQRQTA